MSTVTESSFGDREVGIREFARMVHRSHPWVIKQIQQGNIQRNENGKIQLQAAMEWFNRYAEEKGILNKIPEGADLNEELLKAKINKENSLATINGIRAAEAQGKVIAVSEVEEDAREVAMKLRAFCLSAPTRYAGLLENRTQRQAEAVLQDLFSELLERIHSGRFFNEEGSGDGHLE